VSWQRRLKEIALAGGLVGGCAANVATSGSNGAGGHGTTAGTGGSTGSSSSSYVGPPPCNLNPDPCCLCSAGNSGHGGYGGASCVDQMNAGISCKDELSCIAMPTAACCKQYCGLASAAQSACLDAGVVDSGCP
jgi:hypothetical protein